MSQNLSSGDQKAANGGKNGNLKMDDTTNRGETSEIVAGDSVTGQPEVTIIKEGKARIAFHGPVFYNPVQEFNRDLTVLVLRQFVADREKVREVENKGTNENGEPAPKRKKFLENDTGGGIRILDALSASGLRAMRFSQEVPNVDYILANDFSDNAVESIKRNIELNAVQDKVEAHFGDAIMTMMQHREIAKRFHAIDLDPYGTAATFLDSAVQAVAENGILMVTCTDMAVLCGNTPETCYNKYGAITTRTKCCHEMALRILLRAIDLQANRYGRYIEPLLAVSVDFYIRVFVRIKTGAKDSKDSAMKVGHVLVCTGCGSMEVQPILKKAIDGNSVKFTPSTIKQTLMDAQNKCVHCSHSIHLVGPMYTAPIQNKAFTTSLLEQLKTQKEDERFGTYNRLFGMLTTVTEELDDIPLYYDYDQLMMTCKSPLPKALVFRSAILNAGYRVSGSHCKPRSLKTDAPLQVIWDIVRHQAKQNNVTREKLHESSPGYTILSKEIETKVNFTIHSEATIQSKVDNLVRYQVNKGKNWGPKTKAKGSINSIGAGFYVDNTKSDVKKEEAMDVSETGAEKPPERKGWLEKRREKE